MLRLKKLICAVLALIILPVMLPACGNTSDKWLDSENDTSGIISEPPFDAVTSATVPADTPDEPHEAGGNAGPYIEQGRILVAYFSRAGENYNVGVIEKGNTQIIAEMITEATGADMFQIRANYDYPESYDACKEIATQEKANNVRPELAEAIDVKDYSIIFVGYPIWWGDLPMAVYTFLESNDFTGKTVIPFNTHEGSGQASTVQAIEATCSGAEVLSGLAIRGSIAQDDQDSARETVLAWLQNMGFTN